MSLVYCRVCKEQVAANAQTCPKCGVKTPSMNNYKIKNVVWCLASFGLGGAMLANLYIFGDLDYIFKYVGIFLVLGGMFFLYIAVSGKDID